MASFIIDGVLLVALFVTTLSMLAVHRRLRRLDGRHRELKQVFAAMTASLESAGGLLAELQRDGCSLAVVLGERTEEARALLGRLEAERRRPAAVRGGLAPARGAEGERLPVLR